MNNLTARRLYTALANLVPVIFIVWLSMMLYHRYVRHDQQQYFVLGLWVLMVAAFGVRVIYLYRHGWDAATRTFDDAEIKRRLYLYTAIIGILIVLNLVAVWIGR